jgi:hypothetical protein
VICRYPQWWLLRTVQVVNLNLQVRRHVFRDEVGEDIDSDDLREKTGQLTCNAVAMMSNSGPSLLMHATKQAWRATSATAAAVWQVYTLSTGGLCVPRSGFLLNPLLSEGAKDHSKVEPMISHSYRVGRSYCSLEAPRKEEDFDGQFTNLALWILLSHPGGPGAGAWPAFQDPSGAWNRREYQPALKHHVEHRMHILEALDLVLVWQREFIRAMDARQVDWEKLTSSTGAKYTLFSTA